MLWAVSTIKDTPAGVRRFADRNLAAGVDHLFVFIDDADEGVLQELTSREHVTPVRTDQAYWAGSRPDVLNLRQRVNANLVNTLLAPIDPTGWLFHIDGDECVEIDRGAVEALDPGTTQITLPSSEAVSAPEGDGGEDTWFKRLLPYEDLALLTALGVIERPDNGAYFHGHTVGKSGLRPRVDRYVHVHGVTRRGNAARLPAACLDDCRVLHYESHSAEEFVRKWSQHVTGGVTAVRPARRRILGAIAAVNRNQALSAQRKHEMLHLIYRRWVADDATTLSELGLLARADPRLHHYPPRAMPGQQAEDIAILLPRLLSADKTEHRPTHTVPYRTLTSLAEELQAVNPDLAARLSRCLRMAGTPPERATA